MTLGTQMIFNCRCQIKKIAFATLSFVFFAASAADNRVRAEPRQEANQPSASPMYPRLAEDQLKFEEGVQAYDAGDQAAAFAIWLPLAKAGDLAAQRNVAHLLRKGLGVEADPTRALFFYERAARAGLASAALNAGMMRLEEDADYFDPRKAAEWHALAAAAGSPIAQWELSQLLASGEGGRKDPEAALLLLQQAAAGGHEEAIAQLDALSTSNAPAPEEPLATEPQAAAVRQTPRLGTPEPPMETSGQAAPVSPEIGAAFMEGVFLFEARDYSAAAEKWLPLAQSGIIEAQYRLGRLYQFGMGVPHDQAQARSWFLLASAAGHDAATNALTALSLPDQP